ncbi:MAG: threonine--tRNA ligase [Deltaproteobacteria bacterium]|jgi:threonyl-tRNA synthetase|nr:threonine--tRNA ligase [Deltaproteobacteria bacterium]
MSTITVGLPDGRTLEVPAGATVLDVAREIGEGLARAALAGRIAGELVDLRQPLLGDVSKLEIVTSRDPDGADVIRHSAEHVMADAVKRLFPEAQVDVGRADHSEKFQYDFKVAEPFSPEDLEKIEAQVRKIVKEKSPFAREEVSREDARALFAELGEELKLSRLDDIPEGAPITLFRHGEFVDLCRGPHVQNAKQIGAVKLLEAAGAYWRGDESNPMLQRIYGTAFATKQELQEHLERIEEAKKRDHRRVGPQLELFHLDPLSPGSPFFLPKGMVLYNGLVDFVKALYPKYGYHEVMAPQLFRADIYKTSGHYQNFHDDMFWFAGADEGEELGVKGMNCPGHCRIFSVKKRSYRELPLRLAEFSRLHRNERSGTLTGLARVRSFAQDDAHIYCEHDQVETEIHRFFEMMTEVYTALGLEGVEINLETRPEQGFIGEPADWEVGERQLEAAVRSAGYDCGVNPGEAAFYGPKIACDFRDVLGRSWTLGTLQIDMAMPGRFGLRYIGRDGQEHQPAMLHRAVLGSIERFLAVYIEHTGGDFPLWLAPVQVALLPITDRHAEYAGKVRDALEAAGIRVSLDDRSEKLGFKIREAELQKIPIMAVLGDQEQEQGTVTPRVRSDESRGGEGVSVDTFVSDLAEQVARRQVTPGSA